MATVKSFGRLVYIEPNDLVSSQNGGAVQDNVPWNMEDLNMSVDIQVLVPNRSDCGELSINDTRTFINTINYDETTNAGKFISFMQGADIYGSGGSTSPKGHELTTDYIEASYTELYKDGKSNKEALGIESVDITFDQHFYPQVNIKFIDVRGYSLMMPSEEEYLGREEYKKDMDTVRTAGLKNGGYTNFFRALFHFPYPKFLLTIKGFFGTSITFTLAVNEFKTNFNSQTGNFEINVSFIGYMYGLYTDIPLNLLIAAPYYGLESISNETSNVWESKGYQFDDGSGGGTEQEMCTFIEFRKRCNELNQEGLKVRNGTSSRTALNRVGEITDEISVLESIESKLRLFVSKVLSNLNTENDSSISYVATKDGRDYAFFGDGEKIIPVPVDEWNAFVDAWYEYDKVTLDVGKWLDPALYDSGTGRWRKLDDGSESGEDGKIYLSSYPHIYTATDDGGIEDGINNYPTVAENDMLVDERELLDEMLNYYIDVTSRRQSYILTSRILASVIDRIDSLKTERSGLGAEADNEMEGLYQTALGFTPSVLNIYRMLFAHVDCFMGVFYDTVMRIKDMQTNQERTLQAFSDCGFDKEKTDLNKNTVSKDFVPPFPSIYQEVNGKREEVYPGDIDKLRPLMPEVEFTENLLYGTLGLKKRYDELTVQPEDMSDYSNATENASKDNTYKVSLLTDIWNTGSPYQHSSYNDFSEVLYIYLLRHASCIIQNVSSNNDRNLNLINNDVPSIEANNYIKYYGDVVGTDMKAQVLEAYSTPTAFLNKCFRKSGLVATPDIEQGANAGVKFRIFDIPMWFASIFEGGSSAQVFIDDKSDRRVFSINSKSEMSGIEDIKNRIPEGSYGSSLSDRIHCEAPSLRITTPLKLPSKATVPLCGTGGFYDGYLKSKDAQYKYGNGGLFISNEFKSGFSGDPTYTDEKKNDRKAFTFLMWLVNKQTGSIDLQTLGSTGITRVDYPSVLLLGCALSNMHTSGFNIRWFGDRLCLTGSGRDGLHFQFSSQDVIGNLGDEKTKRIISVYTSFVNNTFPKILNEIEDIDNYVKDGSDYLMGGDLKKYVFDTMYGDNLYDTDRYIYEIEEEYGSYEVFIPINSIQRFIRIIADQYRNKETRGESNTSTIRSSDVTSSYKLALYNTLKNLYDKWLSTYDSKDFILRSPSEDRMVKTSRYVNGDTYGSGIGDGRIHEFDNFVFVDCFFNDLSYKFLINPDTVLDIIDKQIGADLNYSVYQFMAEVAQKNRMLFQALPVYNNFYNASTIGNVFKPNIKETMLRGFGSTYMCMYAYEVSHVIEDTRSLDHMCSDGVDDLCGITDDPSAKDCKTLFADNTSGAELPITIPAFGVTYARQNQMYFKNVNVSMDNPKVTDYSLMNLYDLANQYKDHAINRPKPMANDIYSIYANRSYECTVDMMGCANIMPMMYFQLNNIPMFRGAYMIYSVAHHIKAGDFTTTFKGVRISKNQIPYNKDLYSIDKWIDSTGIRTGATASSPVVNTVCGNFDISMALAMMSSSKVYCKRDDGKPFTVPFYTNDSQHVCACAVRQFIEAGLQNGSTEKQNYNSLPKYNKGSYPNAVQWHTLKIGDKTALEYIGFELKHIIEAGKTREEISSECSTCIPGDIAVMYRRNNENAAGHMCMLYGTESGKQVWVSDFKQMNGPYVYFKKNVETTNSKPIYIYRFTGCKPAEVQAVDYDDNLDSKGRGKYIMKQIQSAFGLTDEQAIGIGSSLYAESTGWNPKVKPGDGGAAVGIAQWHPDRQSRIVNYLNGVYNSGFGTGRNFSSIPLDKQVEGLIWECRNSETSVIKALRNGKADLKYKNGQRVSVNTKTTKGACQAWSALYERCTEKMPYNHHCSYIQEATDAFNS